MLKPEDMSLNSPEPTCKTRCDTVSATLVLYSKGDTETGELQEAQAAAHDRDLTQVAGKD